jgi:hypothetical protein
MPDYYAQASGVFPSGRRWSTARHITSQQLLPNILATWGAAWNAAWTDAAHGLDAAYPVGTVLNEYTVAQLDGNFREIAKQGLSANQPGVNAGKSLPASVAVVMSWRSAGIGRHFRGFQSMPAPAEDQVNNDMVIDTARDRFTAALRAIQTAIQADGSTFFTFNRVPLANGTPPGNKVVLTEVSTRDKVGSRDQRLKHEPATYR